MGTVRSMRISEVQQGLIVQQEFAKLVMLGSKGRIELAPPLTDDERRDWELHVRGQFGFGIAAQVKSTMNIHRQGRITPILHCFFQVPIKHLVTSPLFYYFLAYLDPKLMRLADPVFLIPSTFFHKYAGPRHHGAYMQFTFMGSMSPNSHDRWQPYQVNTLELGQKVLDVMAELNRRRVPVDQAAAAVLSMPDALRLMPANRRDGRQVTRSIWAA
jgi:hypothetical protein